ncbi:MAG: flagellar filament capping protein FliD [Dechloromonas sp.]|nr:flagellar filament capping protein FliD [Dechloromonas sp.]
MSTLTSLGIGSGLDVESIITQLMTIERRPLTQLDTKESSVKSKISAFGSISSALSTLKDAATTLATPSKLAGYTATFADSSIASGSATSSSAAGTYAINVKRLATAHKVSSDTSFSSMSQVVGAGSFTLNVGSQATSIETSGSASLGDLRDKINAADAGVTANLITSDGGTRLVMTAKNTGEAISVSNVQDLNTGDAGDFVALLSGFTTVGGPHTVSSNNTFSGPTEQLGPGTLNITVGSTTTAVAIGGANASLLDIKNAINTAGAGVTADIVTDTSGTRLQLTSQNANELVSYTAVDDNSTDGLDFSKLRGFSTVGNEPQIAQKALVEIDGLAVTSDSNAITTAITGVTLNLGKVGTTSLTVARNTATITDAVNSFVTAYNALNSKIKTLTAYNATDQTGSILTGDATVRAIQNQISSLMFNNSTDTSAIDTLSDLGISFSSNGNIAVDSSKLAEAIASDPAAVISTLGTYGTSFKSTATALTSTSGLLTSRTAGLNLSIKDFDDQRERLDLRMTAIENRYRQQYASLDTIVSSMQQTSSYLTQQLAALS